MIELGEIKRQMSFADGMKRAHHATFQERKFTLDRICVDGEMAFFASVFIRRMFDCFVR